MSIHRSSVGVMLAIALASFVGCRVKDEPTSQRLGIAADLGRTQDLAVAPAQDLAWPEWDFARMLPPPDAGDLPPIACAGDAGTCRLPPSVCGNDDYLVYYTNARCVDGMCHFDKQLHLCQTGCQRDGCSVVITSLSISATSATSSACNGT